MKPLPVAPSRPVAGAVSLLHFYRDVIDKLSLWRLTERDEAVLQAAQEATSDLLASCAKLTRQMQRAGLLTQSAKIVELRPVNNPENNRCIAGFE